MPVNIIEIKGFHDNAAATDNSLKERGIPGRVQGEYDLEVYEDMYA